MKKIIIMISALALVLAGCAAEIQPVPELLTPVGSRMDTAVTEIGVIEDIEIYEAAIIPEYHELFFTHEARIGNVPVTLGSPVKAGDVLVEMDVSSVNSAIASLESERSALISEGEYEKALYDIDMELFSLEIKKLTGDAAYEMETEMALYELEYKNSADARAERLLAIETELENLALSLEGTFLTSPCDGRVTYMGAARGQTAGAYDTVCVVTDESTLTLKSDFISPATIASAAEIYAVIDGERLEITPRDMNEDEYSRAVLRGVEYLTAFDANLPQNAHQGKTCIVYAVTQRLENVLRVPINAVFTEDDEDYVYLVDGESRIRTGVSVGSVSATHAEITSGIEEGDVVYVGD